MSGTTPFRLLAITPSRSDHPGLDGHIVAAAEEGGGAIAILLRDRGMSSTRLRRWTEDLAPIIRATGALLLVHGDARIARDCGIDGVHLPEAGPAIPELRAMLDDRMLIGASRHDAAGVLGAAGADYATLSPIFHSPGKGVPLGLAGLSEACRISPRAIVALGGITSSRVAPCLAAGAASVAAIRAVWSGDVKANVRALLAAVPPPPLIAEEPA